MFVCMTNGHVNDNNCKCFEIYLNQLNANYLSQATANLDHLFLSRFSNVCCKLNSFANDYNANLTNFGFLQTLFGAIT